jgi:hypothetical protein
MRIKFYIKGITALGLFLNAQFGISQEQVGLRLDNYAGVNALTLNPAANHTNPFSWDANLLSFSGFLGNDVGYLAKSSLLSLSGNLKKVGPDPALGAKPSAGTTIFGNFYDRDRTKYFSTSIEAMGPSLSVNLENGHSFGLFTRARFMMSSHNIPKVLGAYEYERQALRQSFKVDAFSVTAMAWSELGVNYSYRLGGKPASEGGVTFGANARKLFGFQSFCFKNFMGTEMTRLGGDSVRFSSMNIGAEYTNAFKQTDKPTSVNGSGWGFDLGVVMTTPGDGEKPYGWRAGASLVDVGSVTMMQNSEVYNFKMTENTMFRPKEFSKINFADPFKDVAGRVSQKVYGSPDSIKAVYTAVSMGLPTAFVLQGDYAFTKEFFLGAVLVQRMTESTQRALMRDNVLAVAPRYESRWFGGSLNMELLNYSQVRMGMSARIAFLTIGTDHMLSYFAKSKLNGSDFYMALKLNPFKMGSSSGRNKGKRGKMMGCYRF